MKMTVVHSLCLVTLYGTLVAVLLIVQAASSGVVIQAVLRSQVVEAHFEARTVGIVAAPP